MAQDPDTAKFDGMPLNIIGTGLTDQVLPPEEMPEHLLAYVSKLSKQEKNLEALFPREKLQTVFSLLRRELGHDFTHYKPKTMMRRISRRMSIHQLETIEEYIDFLENNRGEINLLFRELLIRVTNFFRDSKAFEILGEKILPRLNQFLSPYQTLRVWVPACSTGEEAYSVAIILEEYSRENNQKMNFQVFATDIDQEAIETARSGSYTEAISVDVSKERLKRYFSKVEGSYQVNKQIREKIVFAVQNIISDPPLSKMDLICCRNLLIYLNNELQKKVLAIFHYALRPHGILFLGASESVGSRADLFSTFDSKWKFYTPVGRTWDYESNITTTLHPADTYQLEEDKPENRTEQDNNIGDLARKTLNDLYAPPAQ